MATTDLKSNPDFLPDIDKIVKRIATHYQLQKKYTPPGHDCNQFTMPAVPPAWRVCPINLFRGELWISFVQHLAPASAPA